MPDGYAIFAHGSRVEAANEAVREVARRFGDEGGFPLVEACFLELGMPSLGEAADALIARGADRIVVVPYFLTPGRHVQRDLPALVSGIRQRHPGIEVSVAESLDGHAGLISILVDRARSV